MYATLERLDKGEVLPPFPPFLSKLSDVDTNFEEVVEIIAVDPSLTVVPVFPIACWSAWTLPNLAT